MDDKQKRSILQIGLILDLVLILVDFSLGWIWPKILPMVSDVADRMWPGLIPIFAVATILYVAGLWFYREPLKMLSKETLAAAKFDDSIKSVKESDVPVLVFSSEGRTVSRAGFDMFWFIGFNAVLLVLIALSGTFLFGSGMDMKTRIVAALSLIALTAVAVAVHLAFWVIGRGNNRKTIDRNYLLITAILQMPFFICLMGFMSAEVGSHPMPDMIEPTLVMKISQIPMFGLLSCFTMWFALYIPRRIWSLALPGAQSRWKFWGLLFISYTIRYALGKIW